MIQKMFTTVDTKKTNYKNVGKINHGDDLILELTVLSDGDMISFNDPMVDLLVKKSDGKMVRQTSGIELTKPNIFVIEVSKDCVTSPGLTTNQLIINDDGRVSTCMFYYTVLNSLEEDVMPSISNVEVLEQLDEFVVQIQDKMEVFDSDLTERMDELTYGIVELEKNFNDTSSALNEAEIKRSEAEQLRAQAEALRVQNEDKRAESENVRVQNESDRAAAELIREQREVERVLNDEERHQNESERAMNELVRQQNENTRQSNEAKRIANESDRKTQENRRATAETNRVNAETTRRNNENSRISNETERQKTIKEMKSLIDETEQNENTRQSNESIRMSNETDRKTQENSRVTAETNRVNAETNRVNAETTRRNNENSRISNETERQKTIEEMKSLIDEANGFVERIRVIEDGIDDVCDSKIDFFGKEHDKLNTRLNADFDNVHQRINESELIPYEGANIKADNTYYGLQKDTVVKGRTLQNLVPTGLFESYKAENWRALATEEYYSFDNGYLTLNYKENGYVNAYANIGNLFKPNTVYTMVFDLKENTLVRDAGATFIFISANEEELFNEKINSKQIEQGLNVFKLTTKSDLTNVTCINRTFIYNDIRSGHVIFRFAIYEGDHTQTPLEELPYIEGIESVGISELTDEGYKISGKSCGKNLCIGIENYNAYYDDTINAVRSFNANQPLSVNLKPNTTYTRITYDCEFDGDSDFVFMFDSVRELDNSYKQYPYYLRRGTTVTTFTTGEKGGKNEYIFNPESGTAGTVGFSVKIGKLAILEGDFTQTPLEELPYEPYQESTYSCILNEPLRSLPNGVRDTIDLEKGVLTRRVGKIVLNGSENWSATGYGGHATRNTFEYLLITNETTKFNTAVYGYCDKFPYEVTTALPKSDGIRVMINNRGDKTNNYFLICPSTSLIPYRDVTAWKDYLKDNNVTVYYPLSNETTEQLTPQQLKSFDTTTHIISNNKLMSIASTKIHSNVQAIISTLKLENSDLKNNVELLSVENEELKETNDVQDEMIDISMMATDEMYSMLEPLLENTPMPIEFENGVSKLAYMYVAMVQRRLKTIDQVPARYREQVRAMIQYN